MRLKSSVSLVDFSSVLTSTQNLCLQFKEEKNIKIFQSENAIPRKYNIAQMLSSCDLLAVAGYLGD